MVRFMIIAIFIFFLIILIAGTDIRLHIKSKDDSYKICLKFGFVWILLPHQQIFAKFKQKVIYDNKMNIFGLLRSNSLLLNICKHSCLNVFYVAKFAKEDLYINPIKNGLYHILANQIKGILSIIFKRIDKEAIKLVYDIEYENLDYCLEIKTNLISIFSAWIESKMKG